MARIAVGQLAEGGASGDLPPGKWPCIITDARWVQTPRGDVQAEISVIGLGSQAGKRASDRLFVNGPTAKILAGLIKAAMTGYPNADTLSLDSDLDATLRVILMGRVVTAEIGERTYTKRDGTTGTATSLLGAGPVAAAEKAYASDNWQRWWNTVNMINERAVSPVDLVYEAATVIREKYPTFLPAEAISVGPPDIVDLLVRTLGANGPVLPLEEVPF